MSQPPPPAANEETPPLSLGAFRFAGNNISLYTSASDLFSHVREVVEFAASLALLQGSFQLLFDSFAILRFGRGVEVAEEEDLSKKAVLRALLVSVENGELGDRARLWESLAKVREGEREAGQGDGSRLSASPLISFVNKVKAELQNERGTYKQLLDAATDYSGGRVSNMKTMMSLFELLHHRRDLLAELCGHILGVSDLPQTVFVSKHVHTMKVKLVQNQILIEESVIDTDLEIRSAVNALPAFCPNGIHAVPYSQLCRPRKPNTLVKSVFKGVSGSSVSSNGSTGSSGLPKQRRKDSAASLSYPPSATSSGPEADSGTELKRYTRRTTRMNSNATASSAESEASAPPEYTKQVFNPATIIYQPSPAPTVTLDVTVESNESSESPAAGTQSISSDLECQFNATPKQTKPKIPSSTRPTPVVQSATKTKSKTPSKGVLKPSAQAFQCSVQLPTLPQASDPPLSKESRGHIEYIMSALLNHQSAEPFRDPKKPSTDSIDSSITNSPTPSSATTITETASTTSLSPLPQPARFTSVPTYNFSRMADRLKQGGYASHIAFRRDFDAILASTREKNVHLGGLNGKGGVSYSIVELEELAYEVLAAERLETYFMNEWTYFFPEITGKRRSRASGVVYLGGGEDAVVAKVEGSAVKRVKR